MISFEKAEQIALSNLNWDCDILPDSIIEKSYGWYFCFQSKKYIETGNPLDMLVRSGGFIVEKENGKVVKFGSAYSLEKNFGIYEKGLIGKKDLMITKIKDLNCAVRLLHKLRMTFVEPEFEHGVEWKIPKEYNEKQLKIALSNLPHIFKNQDFYFRSDAFEEMSKSDCLVYELKNREK